jgi:hypothetical protein
MKIASLEDPFPRGTRVGKRVGGSPLNEAGNFFRCKICGGWFDARDLAWVEDREGALPHPGTRSGAVASADSDRWFLHRMRERPLMGQHLAKVAVFDPRAA